MLRIYMEVLTQNTTFKKNNLKDKFVYKIMSNLMRW